MPVYTGSYKGQDRADRKGLIGIECFCIQRSLCLTEAHALHSNKIAGFQQQEEDIEDRVCSFGNVKSGLTA
ncbi:hypothetical protein FQA39_LY06975 [Lamprigera yunnana]|nr:hypothetical protein FQA39_LY06975 [Lamprigera yunnana]